eukprot:TRINITY_DN2629_c0_g2_i2.p1 TRINITY_DN2629_c0_g2~~TRINITY_DN2629_c0_g2_i2.p1  ORF type:complete len:540 (+),score=108.12 TRINITY_DN2629_c0_g2_i2:504-2123(+)
MESTTPTTTTTIATQPFLFGFDNPKHSDHVLVLQSDSSVYRRVHVNNLILSANSNYFLNLFTNDMKESTLNEIPIHLDNNYQSILFYAILKSLYTGVLALPNMNEIYNELKLSIEKGSVDSVGGVNVSKSEGNRSEGSEGVENKEEKKGKKRSLEEENGHDEKTNTVNDNNSNNNNDSVTVFESKESQVCLDVLALLDRFLIDTRFAHCIALLKKAVCNSVQTACYQISVLETQYRHIPGIEAYKKALLDFVTKRYTDLDRMWNEDDFLLLPQSVMECILRNDNLLVSCEETVLQALRKWINHNSSKRLVSLPSLLPLIKFLQMDVNYLLEYVLGCQYFFSHSGCEIEKAYNSFCLLQNYVSRAVRYLSFNLLNDDEKFSLSGVQFKNWLQRRSGYHESEASTVVEWECDLEKNSCSSPFYFRGICYVFALVFQQGEHFFCITPDRLLTSGENEQRHTICHLAFTLKAFNFLTKEFDTFKNEEFLIGVNAGCVIDEHLRLLNPLSPYIKQLDKNVPSSSTSTSKRIVLFSVSLGLNRFF